VNAQESFDAVMETLSEVRMLRDVPQWDADDSPMALHATLLDVRARYDRVEAILAQMMERHGRTRALLHEAREAADDAWDAAATSKRTNALDYMAGRERVAHVNVENLAERRRVRALERIEMILDSAVQQARLAHRGLDTVRRDLDTRIRLLTLETRLEH